MNIEKRLSKAEKILSEIRDELKPKPEFKVGDWICFSDNHIGRMYNREHKYPDCIALDIFWPNEVKLNSCHISNCRHATEEEIKSHLIEKYYKDYPDNRFECSEEEISNRFEWYNKTPGFYYNKNADQLVVRDINYYSLIVYQQGKLAEPIKEYPKDIKLSNGDTVEIYDDYLRVGCTRLMFKTIKELYKAIK